MDEATKEALVEAIQAGTEAEYVEHLLAAAWDRGYMARSGDTYESKTPNPFR